MAEKSFPFASVDGDRIYSSLDWAGYFALILSTGVFPGDTELEVSESTGMDISVAVGSAWIDGYAYLNTEAKTLSIDAADGVLNRIDRVVVRWGRVERAINLAVIKGEAASTASPPDIVRNSDYYDLSLATVTVSAGVTEILNANISDTRSDETVCGLVSSPIITAPESSGPNQATALPSTGNALADNTEYRVSYAVGTYAFAWPEGNFEAWIKFSTDSTFSISFPAGTTYIGGAPTFAAGKTYEMSVKDGVVVCQGVTSS